MQTPDDRTPILVGVGQLLQRAEEPGDALSPLAMLEDVARHAAEDAGGGSRLLAAIDTCGLLEIFGWTPQNGSQLLGEQLGAQTRHHLATATGGETGLTLLNHVAERVTRGETRVGLVAGCNNLKTLSDARARKLPLDWPVGGHGKPELLAEMRWGTSDREQACGMRMPVDIYPLYENALRAQQGADPRDHLLALGRLMSRFSEVAAKNPYAWFPTFRSPEELVRVTQDNRMIAWPYPKYLNAVMTTDQAAGALVTSVAAARELGLPEDRWVYWRAGAYCEEPIWFASERRDFHSSPALRAAVDACLERARLSLDDVHRFDFYSCFPSAVGLACRMLGLSHDDPRGLTVTGGLPYAGGPGNSYTLHAVAAMVERLREHAGSRGLLTGIGWYMTKLSAALLASEPPSAQPATGPVESPMNEPVPIVDEAQGPARIETYTVRYARDGTPERGIVVGRLQAGQRFLANTPNDRALLESLVEREGVGRSGRVQHADGRNLFHPS